MKKFISTVALFALVLLPAVTFAQFGKINDFLGDISGFINNTLIPLLFAVALLFFLYGVFNFLIVGREDGEKREIGKSYMIYAIVGFVIMVSVFGIVNLIAGGLGFSNDENIKNIPNVPTTNR